MCLVWDSWSLHLWLSRKDALHTRSHGLSTGGIRLAAHFTNAISLLPSPLTSPLVVSPSNNPSHGDYPKPSRLRTDLRQRELDFRLDPASPGIAATAAQPETRPPP